MDDDNVVDLAKHRLSPLARIIVDLIRDVRRLVERYPHNPLLKPLAARLAKYDEQVRKEKGDA